MTFGSPLMQPSSSMWTRVALRVTTPFPLQTLLGSKSENNQNRSIISTALHRSRHSSLIFGINRQHSCFRAPGNPSYCNRMPQMTKIELTVTSKPGHQINILLSCKTNCHDHTVRAGSREVGAGSVSTQPIKVTPHC